MGRTRSGFFLITNASLGQIDFWDSIWAVSNYRPFDLVAALTMALIFAWPGFQRGQPGVINLISRAFIGAMIGSFAKAIIHEILTLNRHSPTLMYSSSQRLSELVPWINTKDASSNSFPGDHGLILLTLTLYGWPYLTRNARYLAATGFIAFSLPRLMSGAHWLTDIAVGSSSIALIAIGLFYAFNLDVFTNAKLLPFLERLIGAICPSGWRKLLGPR